MLELSLATFVARVADAPAVPASGCVAALQGALGAALVSMAFGHAAGEGRSGESAYVRGRAEELGALSERLLELVDEDARAYGAWSSAGGREERAKAARIALETPLEIAETALAALRLAAVGAADVRRALDSECRIGADSLRAAVDAGVLLVRANARGLAAPEQGIEAGWVDERLVVAEGLARQAAVLSEEVRAARAAGSEGSERA